MCTLFIGPATAPSLHNIKHLKPVLVSKTRVETIIQFLLGRNAFYTSAGLQFSASNLDDIFPGSHDEGVPQAVELCCLPDATLEREGYSDRGGSNLMGRDPVETGGETVMEAIGYILGESSAKDLRDMKASAVAWCLDRNNYMKMQSGSKFLSDRDPGFLTFNFPHLDPWDIGGFHEPNRLASKDPNFVSVSWNIIQKTEVNKQINFRTSSKLQADVIADIQATAPLLTDLMRKWELNPNAKATTKEEKRAIKTLSRLKIRAKDLKGSSGYKQCQRNEIRALIKKLSMLALFITLNPADICDPLLASLGGLQAAEWHSNGGVDRKISSRSNGTFGFGFRALTTES
ncbi:hypothetical protein K438DRAFT_1907443 [Mycena galopus ATCC 62051]|nr:hypothetical protein K438DRAFT_1907443 [Mycena galopus ATCC 62051]